MEFIDKIGINKHEIIIERGVEFAKVLTGEEKEYVLSVVQKSKDYIKELGESDNVVYSPTKREMATFKVSFKRYVRTDFIDPVESRINQIETDTLMLEKLCKDCLKKPTSMYCTLPDLCNSCQNQYDRICDIWHTQWERLEMIEKSFQKAVDETVIPDELIGNWMLLMRKMREEKESKDIDKALKEFIRDELINEFRKQNEQLLKKYNLWQSQ